MHSPIYVVCFDPELKNGKLTKDSVSGLSDFIYSEMSHWADYVNDNDRGWDEEEGAEYIRTQFADSNGNNLAVKDGTSITIKKIDIRNYSDRKIHEINNALKKINVDNYLSYVHSLKGIIAQKGGAWICEVDSYGEIDEVSCLDDWIHNLNYVFNTDDENEEVKFHILKAYDYHW